MKKLLILMLMAAASVMSGQQYKTPEISIPLMTQAPVIDGNINPAEWASSARMERFCHGGPEAFPAEASFWVGSDGKKLFVAVRSEAGPNGILQRVRPQAGNAMVWLDDNIEMVIIPDLKAKSVKMFHSIINNQGALYSQSTENGNPVGWKGKWEVKGTEKNGFWEFEAAIPLTELGFVPGRMPETTGMRICRGWQRMTQGAPQTSWSPFKCAFFSSDYIPIINWFADAPVVQHLQLKDSDVNNGFKIKASIRNPGAKMIKVNVLIAVKPKNSAPVEKKDVIEIAPGCSVEVEAAGAALNGESLATVIEVTSPDHSRVYYYRGYNWTIDRPDDLFSIASQDTERLAVKFAFFPSYNKIRLQLDAGALKDRDAIKGINVELKDAAGKSIAATSMPLMKKFISDMIWEIPDLKAHTAKSGRNEYSLTFDVVGVKGGKITKTFVRNIMPWEGCELGKSDLIVPPFTPIEVSGMSLNTILRSHELNKLGLWTQVDAAGEPLLKEGGMRLEAVINGKNVPITVSTFNFPEKKPSRVKTESVFSAGSLNGKAVAVWDYDGMMKWTMTLNPCPDKIDSLKLVIPLDDSKMPLFHTCTDGIRINYAGAIPAGMGKVWDGSKCSRNSIIGSYVPYIWLGDELRGLSIFGENDKGWVPSEKVPCQELVRRNGTLYLIMNLIATPVKIEKERQLTIGFEATPVKPMPENWRKWNAWSYYGRDLVKQFDSSVNFFASCYYWGTPTPCLDLYPLNEDITYWQELGNTRKTGKINKDFIEKWLKKYRLSGKPGSKVYEEQKLCYVNHVNAGFRQASSPASKGPTMFYTNARGVRWDTPEGQTFVDEWHRLPFISRKFDYLSGPAYDLDPVESFRDYAMWWYKKMFDTGATDLIYWDDVFMQSTFNLVGSEAYCLEDGSIQPASGLFNMRELIRRTAILQLESGKPVNNMVHMTNTAIVPICAFAEMNYDWEDHIGHKDFQDRYTPEYIRATSIGRQFGNFPVVLAPVSGTPEQFAWCERTATGVMTTHELRWSSNYKHYWQTQKTIYDFGYGAKDVKVYNYWDKEFPLRIEGIKSSSIVLAKNGAVMIMVCDYSGGGNVKIIPDLKKIGLNQNFTATDLETHKMLEVNDGIISLSMKKHDYVLILLK